MPYDKCSLWVFIIFCACYPPKKRKRKKECFTVLVLLADCCLLESSVAYIVCSILQFCRITLCHLYLLFSFAGCFILEFIIISCFVQLCWTITGIGLILSFKTLLLMRSKRRSFHWLNMRFPLALLFLFYFLHLLSLIVLFEDYHYLPFEGFWMMGC